MTKMGGSGVTFGRRGRQSRQGANFIIAQNWFYLSHYALGPKCTPTVSTKLPHLVGDLSPGPEIWGFKLAKIVILRRPDTSSSSIALHWLVRSHRALA